MLEPLEDRRLLALTDLAAITGTLYYNLLPGNVEQPIANQPVRLYQDGDGDNVFDGAPTDPLKDTQLTNAQGEFRFDNLTAGTYFVQQPPEPSGNIHPAPVPIVRTIIVTPADADGDEGVVVDHFEDPQTLVAQLPPAGTPSVSDSIFAPGALGDYRQMDVNAVSGTGQVRVEIDVNNNDVFDYSEEAATAGNATAIWDGTPGVHANVVPTGLGGEDLTGGGVQDSFVLLIPISDVPAKQTLTVYTDATHASQTTVDVPRFALNLTQRVMFSSLTQLPGMAGPADFANVGAITFSIIKAQGFPDFGLDYQLHSISTVGPKVLRTTLPFDVTSEIQIVKLTNGTDNNSPTGPVVPVGSTVTFTYIVTNTGNVPLANLVVTDDKGVTVSGPAPGGDTDGDGLLDVNETWTYTASTIAVPGQYVNNGTVAGTPVTETGEPILDVPPVTDEDLEYHFGREKPPIIVLGPEKNPGTPQAVRVVDSNTGEVLSSFVAYEDDYVGGTRVAVADLDGDGTDEIITAPGRNRPPEIRVFTQEGDAVPGFPSFLANSATFRGGTHLTVADVNGDGKPDMITVPSYGASNVRVFLNQYPANPAFQATPDLSFQAFPVASIGGAVVAAGDVGRLLPDDSFVDWPDGKAEIVVATGVGTKATVSVFDVSTGTRKQVQDFSPFTAVFPNFTGGVALDVAEIDGDGIPDIVASMGVNGVSRIEVWDLNTGNASPVLLGAIPKVFTGPSNNAPVNVAAMDTSGDGIADAIFAVQGPIGTVGEVHRFDITGRSPLAYQEADPLTGFSGPWFIATSKSAPSGPVPQPGPLAAPAITVWTNPDDPFDVNNEGFVSPLDVLVTINHINSNPGGTSLPAQQFSPPRFFDTNVDGLVTAGDVLLVLNYLNSSVAGAGEGEASESEAEVAALFSSWAWAAGPTLPRSASSTPEAGRDQVLGTLAAASVPDTEWYLADMELESPPSAHSFQTPLDEPDLVDLEAVLEEIAAEIAAA